jgi:hypothetical protein
MPEDSGIYHKFNVSRVDQRDAPGGDRFGAKYFVLDYTNDKFSKPALLAYAAACEAELPLLAAAIRAQYV